MKDHSTNLLATAELLKLNFEVLKERHDRGTLDDDLYNNKLKYLENDIDFLIKKIIEKTFK